MAEYALLDGEGNIVDHIVADAAFVEEYVTVVLPDPNMATPELHDRVVSYFEITEEDRALGVGLGWGRSASGWSDRRPVGPPAVPREPLPPAAG